MRPLILVTLIMVSCLGFSSARPENSEGSATSVEESPKEASNEAPEENQRSSRDENTSAEPKKKKADGYRIPTIDPKVVREVLKDKQQTRKMVDCVLDFTDEDCPAELKNVNKMAPDIFRRGGRCYRCTAEDKKRLRQFLVDLQRAQPSEYRRMIRQLNKTLPG